MIGKQSLACQALVNDRQRAHESRLICILAALMAALLRRISLLPVPLLAGQRPQSCGRLDIDL